MVLPRLGEGDFLGAEIRPAEMSGSAPAVSVIILNWNGHADTVECLESVSRIDYPSFRVLVVDNGSTDGSVAAIRAAFPEVEILETGRNLGYAGGNNAGIRHVLVEQPDVAFVLLLNNDVVVDPGILRAFVEAASAYPEGGIFGGKSYYYSKPDVVWALGGHWDSAAVEIRFIEQGCNDAGGTPRAPFEVDYVIGCALFFRVDMLRRTGMMDEAFFLNFEEMDWCYRARRLGVLSYAVPAARIWHKVSVSFGGGESPLWKYFMTRNELLWARRHLPFSERLRVSRKVLGRLVPDCSLGNGVRHGLARRLYWEGRRCALEGVRRSRDPYYQAQFFGIAHYLFRRLGDCPDRLKEKFQKTVVRGDG